MQAHKLQVLLALAASALATTAAQAAPRVLQVGTWHGREGAYHSVQAAVEAAHPGDWILIAPGDYHEQGAVNAGVWITTPNLHLRGMERNGVIIDGTRPGSGTCSPAFAAQDFGVSGGGRNGIEVYKADGVSIENLTVCNFMSDAAGGNGNQIWWNGGDGSGVIGMGAWQGAWLTASSTFYDASLPDAAQYGIFISNARGPGVLQYAYASNMADSAFYVGACPDCNAELRFLHAQNSAQGYSGSNSGGHLVIELSEWDHNQAGIVPSSLAGDDLPAPQDGACPGQPDSSCTFIQYNYVHDNNNPNTPAAGLAATVPVGTGIDLTGGHNNTVRRNLISNNGAWGVLLNDYPDYTPDFGAGYCSGGVQDYTPVAPYDQLYAPNLPVPCWFQSIGNRVQDNVFASNGSFGNPGNADLGDASLPNGHGNCFHGNRDARSGSASSAPEALQSPAVAGRCGQPWNPDTAQEFNLQAQLGCDSLGPASGACTGLTGPLYPLRTQVTLMPVPREAGMPDACSGVPKNSWCP